MTEATDYAKLAEELERLGKEGRSTVGDLHAADWLRNNHAALLRAARVMAALATSVRALKPKEPT